MLKRAFDAIASGIALLITAPLLALIAVAVRCDSPGPTLYKQRRVGRGGKEFTILKFRSMRVEPTGSAGRQITAADDPRVTRVGRFLRRSKLDELPQLWNVLRGDMSLVGPRPEVPAYVSRYTAEQRRVLDYRPGITCASSLEAIDEEAVLAAADDPETLYTERLMPRKVEAAIRYARTATLGSDVAVMVKTGVGVTRRSAENAPTKRAA